MLGSVNDTNFTTELSVIPFKTLPRFIAGEKLTSSIDNFDVDGESQAVSNLKYPDPGSVIVVLVSYFHIAKFPSEPEGPDEPEGPTEPEGPAIPAMFIRAIPLVLVILVIPDPVKSKTVTIPKSWLAEYTEIAPPVDVEVDDITF